MANIIPFKGILYNPETVGDLGAVTAPPYDVISPALQEELYNKSDYNIVRLILGKTFDSDSEQNNRYTRSSQDLNDWINKGILQQNDRESLYYYSQEYVFNGVKRNRTGFIARVKLEEFEKGVIFPHENTLSKPKADRLNLTRACKANFSQVFGLFSDPEKNIDNVVAKDIEKESLSEVIDSDGTIHRFGSILNKEAIDQIASLMKEKKIYIADGHHRYEIALNYRNEMRKASGKSTGEEPYDYVMMYLTNMDSEGTSIFPIHRLLFNLDNFNSDQFLESLESYFTVQAFPFENSPDKEATCNRMLQAMESKTKGQFTCGVYQGTQSFYMLTLKDNSILNDGNTPKEFLDLGPFILQSLIFEKIMGISKEAIQNQEKVSFKKSEKEAIKMVDSGEHQVAFFLNSTKMEQIRKACNAGLRMPQKSTFFYPKLLSGLVINPLT